MAMSEQDATTPHRVEILRISGDIYINGVKKLFAVDFDNPPTAVPQYETVEWLIGWAKIGLMSKGHVAPHFPNKEIAEFESSATETRG